MSIVTMDSVVGNVLSVGNKEHNQHYPPHIIDDHWEVSSNFILDRIVELFPGNNGIVDVAKPFLKRVPVVVVNGIIPFPENYRNILGAAITVTRDKKNLCSDGVEFKNDPLKKTELQVEREKGKGNCVSNAVNMVDIDEWDSRTRSRYKFPTYEKPIGCIFEGEGIKICPYDISVVELRYLREPRKAIYGYDQLPDDTFVYNPANGVESEWEQTATAHLFKAMSTLYAIYLRDPEMRDFNMELKKIGIL